MWVKFTQPFDWDPPELGGRVTQSFVPDQVANVRRECGEAAKAAGRAEDHDPKTDGEADRRG